MWNVLIGVANVGRTAQVFRCSHEASSQWKGMGQIQIRYPDHPHAGFSGAFPESDIAENQIGYLNDTQRSVVYPWQQHALP